MKKRSRKNVTGPKYQQKHVCEEYDCSRSTLSKYTTGSKKGAWTLPLYTHPKFDETTMERRVEHVHDNMTKARNIRSRRLTKRYSRATYMDEKKCCPYKGLNRRTCMVYIPYGDDDPRVRTCPKYIHSNHAGASFIANKLERKIVWNVNIAKKNNNIPNSGKQIKNIGAGAKLLYKNIKEEAIPLMKRTRSTVLITDSGSKAQAMHLFVVDTKVDRNGVEWDILDSSRNLCARSEIKLIIRNNDVEQEYGGIPPYSPDLSPFDRTIFAKLGNDIAHCFTSRRYKTKNTLTYDVMKITDKIFYSEEYDDFVKEAIEGQQDVFHQILETGGEKVN